MIRCSIVLLTCLAATAAQGADATLLLFLRPGQSQSADAITQAAEVMAKRSESVEIRVIISGPTAATDAASYKLPAGLSAKVFADADYAFAGKNSVHVWPATVLIGADGKETARIAGLPQSYVNDLAAHLDFIGKKIDKAGLEQRLKERQVVAATSQQAATRHVLIANALVDRGQIEQALKEVDEGLQRQPGEISLRVARAKLLLQMKQPAAALAAAEELADRIPPWQVNLIRAEALIALERWSDAKIAAEEAAKLNPNPAEANYLRGLIYSHDGDWQHAAEAFRRAYEASQRGRQS